MLYYLGRHVYFSVIDPLNNLYRTYSFSYFFSYNNQYLNSYIDDPKLKHRMFLESIKIYDKSVNLIEMYGFEYILPNELPPRLSFAQDHWGYFNGAHNTSFVPDPGNDWEGIFPNINNNREANGSFSNRGLLQKITYPTGGSTILEYESNYISTEEIVYSQSHTVSVYVYGTGGPNHSETASENFTIPFEQWCDISGHLSNDYNNVNCDPPDYLHTVGRVRLFKVGSDIPIVEQDLTLNTHPNFEQKVYLLANTEYTLEVTAWTECASVGGHISYFENFSTQSVNKDVGGQRIKTTRMFDNLTGHNEIIKYFYAPHDNLNGTSGKLNSPPIYYSTHSALKSCGFPCEYITCDYVTLHSSSVNTLYNSSGNHFFYQFVTKSFGENFENGGEEYEFKISYDSYGEIIWGQKTILGSTKTNSSWDAGTLLRQKTFKKMENGSLKIVKEVTNTYEVDERNGKEIEGFVIRKRYDPPCVYPYETICTDELRNNPICTWCDADHAHWWVCIGNVVCMAPGHHMVPVYHPCHDCPECYSVTNYWDMNAFEVNKYMVLSRWQYLKKSEVKEYDENGIDYMYTKTEYLYDNPTHAQLSRSYTITSDNKRKYSQILYPDDYTNTIGSSGGPVGILKEKHIINIPIETIQYVSDQDGNNIQVIDGSINVYQSFSDRVLLDHVYQLETALPIPKANFKLSNNAVPGAFLPDEGTLISFNENLRDSHYASDPNIVIDVYDDYSNICQYHKENDINITILWGYDYSFPIAKIENARYDEILSLLGFSYAILQTKNSSELETIFYNLRAQEEMKNAMIYSYTYSQMDGMISETTPNGIKTVYDYDDFGRLSNIRDNDLNIIKHFEYNYANTGSEK